MTPAPAPPPTGRPATSNRGDRAARQAGAAFDRHFGLASGALLRYVFLPVREGLFVSPSTRRQALAHAAAASDYAGRQLRLAVVAAGESPPLLRLKIPLAVLAGRVSALGGVLTRGSPRPAELQMLELQSGTLRAAAAAKGFPVPVLTSPAF